MTAPPLVLVMEKTYLSRLAQVNNTAHRSPKEIVSRCMKTVVEMLHDRCYGEIQTCQSADEVLRNMTDGRSVLQATKSDGEQIRVFFHNEDRVGVKQLRTWTEGGAGDKIIIVSLDGPTSFTRKEAEEKYPNVAFFTFRDLCVNITRHTLVPLHERISASELPFEIKHVQDELPVLYTTDKVAQYYDFQPNDIVRITRTAGVQEPIHYYRLVRLPTSS